MSEADVQEVETYISGRHKTVAEFITTRLIMDLCLTAERRPGAWIPKQRREQEGIDLEGICEANLVAEA